MYVLANKAISLQNGLKMFDERPSDYDTVRKNTQALVALIEEIESFAVSGRKTIAGYQNELQYYTGLVDKTNEIYGKKFLSGIQKNVTVKLENDILTLVLFPLIKNLSARTKEYLSLLIGDAIKEYFATRPKPDFANDKCVIVINSLYARPDMVRDNDSVETATIINALKTHFMTDDDGLHLSVFRMGSLSDRRETEIYLMKEHDFVFWLLSKIGAHETD